jgi:hypothetical protein
VKPWEETWVVTPPIGEGRGWAVSHPVSVPGSEETERARAHLAAAAPELYRALEAILNVSSLRLLDAMDGEPVFAAEAAARAALCKASGE